MNSMTLIFDCVLQELNNFIMKIYKQLIKQKNFKLINYNKQTTHDYTHFIDSEILLYL